MKKISKTIISMYLMLVYAFIMMGNLPLIMMNN